MRYQLRIYTIKPGEMAVWVDEWSRHIAPLRRQHGFEVVGAWTVDGSDRFVWMLAYSGSKSWEEADSDYYASPERASISPDPARNIAANEHFMMSSVDA